MKRHLNTSYRLVWNHITGTLVVASELARSRGKRTGVALALSLATATSVPALAADTVVQAGETVSGGTLTNHDNQIVFGTANGMTISTGLELGPDSEENTGGQWIQNGGIAGNTTVTTNGRQVVLEGGTASDTVIRDGGGQSLNGLAVNTTLNNRGEQWVHEGGVATGTIINRDGYQSVKSGGLATGTIINTGAEGGPDSDNSYTGQKVQGTAESTTINKNGRQIILFSGIARDTLIYAGGDQSVHGRALNTTLNGGYQYVHKDGLALNTVINEGGWQVVKAGGAVGNTTINQNGELRVHAGGEATAVTQNTGGALVTSTAATVTGTNCLGHFSVGNGMADNVVLENGGRLDVLENHSAQNTLVDDGGTLAVSAGGKATGVTMTSGGALIADSGATVEGTNASGKFSIDGISGQASGLLLENGGSFTVNAGGQAGNTTVGYRGTLTLAAGGSLSGRTQLSKGASMVLNGDVVSTGDIVNAGEIYFDNQTTPDAVLSRAVAKGNAPVTFHKLTTSNLTGQGGTINMRVRLDGSNTSDQLVINGGQATGKTWLAFTNVGNSNLGVATTGQGIRVVDAQNGATTEEGAFALSRPLQAGAFNYTLNRDSDEDWYLRSENAYRAEVPLYASMLTQAMDYDRILAGSRSHQTGVSGENNSVRLSIQGGHLGHDNNGGIAR
ncbi:autotransporter adhesin Ag43, partial [Escherichia coli]|nr:autotransporter adhesin Ag43 [Escherichia coli]